MLQRLVKSRRRGGARSRWPDVIPGIKISRLRAARSILMSTTNTASGTETLNGINVTALRDTIDAVRKNPAAAQTRFAVKTDWLGGTVSRTRVAGFEVG